MLVLGLLSSCSSFRSYTIEETIEKRVIALSYETNYGRWVGWENTHKTLVYFDDKSTVLLENEYLFVEPGEVYRFSYYDGSWHFMGLPEGK